MNTSNGLIILSVSIGMAWLGIFSSQLIAEQPSPVWLSKPAELVEGQEACMAVYRESQQSWLIYNLPQCQSALSPCSTFKIPNALLGLQLDVLSGPQHHMQWDGTVHDREVLNQDHDLATAMQNSVVWYFQEMARQIGAERMQATLDAFDYGNRDISGGIDMFWLGSSLEITALQQVEFLRSLVNQDLPADADQQATVLQLLRQDQYLPDDFKGTLYGKTGSCPMPGDDHGWFVGMHQREHERLIFAVNLIGEKAWGPDARRLAIRMLQNIE